jgi:hypothetical protein
VDIRKFFESDLSEAPGDLRQRVSALLSPDMPESLEQLLASLPPRPRYIGPEAWLDALARCSDGAGAPGGPVHQTSGSGEDRPDGR